MSDFIAISNTKESDDLEIKNIAFFPNILIKEVRESQRLDGTVTTTRLKHSIISAIITINDDLNTWRLIQQSKGYNSIKEIGAPNDFIESKSKYFYLYKEAVFCWANALLKDRYLNYDPTSKAVKQNDTEEKSAGDLYRDARYAVRDILGISRSTMALI